MSKSPGGQSHRRSLPPASMRLPFQGITPLTLLQAQISNDILVYITGTHCSAGQIGGPYLPQSKGGFNGQISSPYLPQSKVGFNGQIGGPYLPQSKVNFNGQIGGPYLPQSKVSFNGQMGGPYLPQSKVSFNGQIGGPYLPQSKVGFKLATFRLQVSYAKY